MSRSVLNFVTASFGMLLLEGSALPFLGCSLAFKGKGQRSVLPDELASNDSQMLNRCVVNVKKRGEQGWNEIGVVTLWVKIRVMLLKFFGSFCDVVV